ncbi:DUF2213 domain-containing protein [Leclercia sp.]|uniref:DUF2213 domain-containing protein n=1 Tax=Leclercia sp. TaxID=1898428 RepID=UPI0028AECFCC|nr:DUF2213 domain-containing protein [Leclercia sp.]
MKRIQVNVLTAINAASNISEQIIDGDPHIVIKNVVPLVDDIVMNGGLYPADEIKASYSTLDGKPAPLDHPKVNGKYVLASDVRAVNQYHVGAWVENSSHDGNKTMVDLKVNKRFAEASEKGRGLIARLDALMNNTEAEPIHVSTGLLLSRKEAQGNSKGKKYSWIASNMEFDHLAILPEGTPGAGTPDDGVGIFAANGEEIERITVNLSESQKPDESADHLNKFWLKKLVKYMVNRSDLSFSDITDQIRRILQAEMGDDSWPYIVAVYDDRAGFEMDGQLYQQSYIVQDDMVQLVGERVKAVYKTELEPVQINNEEDEMTEEQMQAILAGALKPVTEQLTAVNAKLGELETDNAKLREQLQANSKKEEEEMRAVVKQHLGDVIANALSGDALADAYARTQKGSGIKGGLPATNSSAEDYSNMEAPE